MSVHISELAEVVAELPELESLPEAIAHLATSGDARFDLLLVANGFEPRAVAITAGLAGEPVSVGTACYFTYSTNPDSNETRRPELLAALEILTPDLKALEADSDPDVSVPAIAALLTEACPADGPLRVLLDTSTCSGRLLLRLVNALFAFDADHNSPGVHLTLAYAQAMEYAPTQQKAAEILKERIASDESGLEGISRDQSLGLDFDAQETCSIDYPGQHLDSLPDRVVLICGFNADRARAVLDRVDTALNVTSPHPQVTHIVGRPAREEDAWRVDAMLAINDLKNAKGVEQGDVRICSTLHYAETLEALERIYETSFGAERLTVVPFGSKLQTLATALFCEMHPDVRVLLARPVRYGGDAYSEGVRELRALRMGPLTETRRLLHSVGEITVTLPPRG